jgi:outer membrane protein TolC
MQDKPRVTEIQLDKIKVYIQMAKTRQIQASLGTERALAALKEAIGLDPDCCIDVPREELPKRSFPLCGGDIVHLALLRRGELVQATSAAEVTALEVEAQGTSCRPKMQTFAALSDLHARPVPQGESNTDYRPGAVGLEMPAFLAGSRSARVELAKSFNARADAVVEKTRNLIALEAEAEFLKGREATLKAGQLETAVGTARKLANTTDQRWRDNLNVTVEEVLTNQVLAGQTQAQLNETRYQQVLALAALERITAGGFCPEFAVAAVRPPAQPIGAR